jgi:hypothetical protein
MSGVSEGIWFPIANNHYLHNPIIDQSPDSIRSIIDKHETLSGKSVGKRFPIANNHYLHEPINDRSADCIRPIIDHHETSSGKSIGKGFPVAHHLHKPINDQSVDNIQPHETQFSVADIHQPSIMDQAADSIQPIINPHETSSGKLTVKRQASIHPTYWSPIGSQAKANFLDGYTQLVTDRVGAGWSCHLVTILFSQLPGTRSTVIGSMRDEVQRLYSTLLTRVHRKPRTASTDDLPVMISVMDLPVHKRDTDGPL